MELVIIVVVSKLQGQFVGIPLTSLWGIPRSQSFSLEDLLEPLLLAFLSPCSGETRLYLVYKEHLGA